MNGENRGKGKKGQGLGGEGVELSAVLEWLRGAGGVVVGSLFSDIRKIRIGAIANANLRDGAEPKKLAFPAGISKMQACQSYFIQAARGRAATSASH